jgi:hypothetical protein
MANTALWQAHNETQGGENQYKLTEGAVMNRILISYDLNTPGQDYPNLIERLKSYGTWWHHLDSLWIIKTSESASMVHDVIRTYLDTNDELLVVNITGDPAAWSGFSDDGSKWLKDNL